MIDRKWIMLEIAIVSILMMRYFELGIKVFFISFAILFFTVYLMPLGQEKFLRKEGNNVDFYYESFYGCIVVPKTYYKNVNIDRFNILLNDMNYEILVLLNISMFIPLGVMVLKIQTMKMIIMSFVIGIGFNLRRYKYIIETTFKKRKFLLIEIKDMRVRYLEDDYNFRHKEIVSIEREYSKYSNVDLEREYIYLKNKSRGHEGGNLFRQYFDMTFTIVMSTVLGFTNLIFMNQLIAQSTEVAVNDTLKLYFEAIVFVITIAIMIIFTIRFVFLNSNKNYMQMRIDIVERELRIRDEGDSFENIQ